MSKARVGLPTSAPRPLLAAWVSTESMGQPGAKSRSEERSRSRSARTTFLAVLLVSATVLVVPNLLGPGLLAQDPPTADDPPPKEPPWAHRVTPQAAGVDLAETPPWIEVETSIHALLRELVEQPDSFPRRYSAWTQDFLEAAAGETIDPESFERLCKPLGSPIAGGAITAGTIYDEDLRQKRPLPGTRCVRQVHRNLIAQLITIDPEVLVPLAWFHFEAHLEQLQGELPWLAGLSQPLAFSLVGKLDTVPEDGLALQAAFRIVWAEYLLSRGTYDDGKRGAEVLEQVLDRLPDHHDIRFLVGYLLEKYGYYGRALKHYDRLAPVWPTDGELHLRRALNRKRQSGRSTAETELLSLARGTATTPTGEPVDSPPWVRRLAYSELVQWFGDDDPERAVTLAREGLDHFPEDSGLRMQLAYHLRLEGWSEALGHLARIEGQGDAAGLSPRGVYDLSREGVLEANRQVLVTAVEARRDRLRAALDQVERDWVRWPGLRAVELSCQDLAGDLVAEGDTSPSPAVSPSRSLSSSDAPGATHGSNEARSSNETRGSNEARGVASTAPRAARSVSRKPPASPSVRRVLVAGPSTNGSTTTASMAEPAQAQYGVRPQDVGILVEKLPLSLQAENDLHQLLVETLDDPEAAVERLNAFQQDIIDRVAGHPVDAEFMAGPQARVIPGLNCLRRLELSVFEQLTRLDPEVQVPLATLMLDLYAHQVGPPRQSWLTEHSREMAVRLTQRYRRGWEPTFEPGAEPGDLDEEEEAAPVEITGSLRERQPVSVALLLAAANQQRLAASYKDGLEAMVGFEVVLAIEKGHPVAHYLAGFLAEKYGQYLRARRHFGDLVDQAPDDFEAQLRFSMARLRSNLAKRGEAGLRLVAAAEDAEDWHRRVAFQELVKRAKDDRELALRELGDALATFPDDPVLRIQHAYHLRIDDWRASVKELYTTEESLGGEVETARVRYEFPRADGLPENRAVIDREVERRQPALEQALLQLEKNWKRWLKLRRPINQCRLLEGDDYVEQKSNIPATW